MGQEVYEVRTIWQYAYKRSRSTFYFLLENPDDRHPWELARDVANNLFVLTNWGARLDGLIANQAFMRQLDIWRILPEWGPGYRQRLQSDLWPGTWSGQSCDNFITANLQWIHDADRTGKHQTRIGPLGAGAGSTIGWFPLFQVAAQAFIVEHITPRVSGLGYSFVGCNLTNLDMAFPIVNGRLHWPPGRQSNRRLEF